MTTTIAPVEQKQRAVVVDVLRGFALIGVLLANFTGFTSEQVPTDILNSISSPLDHALIHVNTVFIEWKFMTLFSILFGYGFGLLLTSVEKKNIRPNAFFARRMFWLFVIGVIHTSFWWFDVLHFYAISGLLLLLFRKAGTRTILLLSVLFTFILPFCFSYAMQNQPDHFTDADFRNAYENFKQGNIVTLFKTNWSGYYKMYILSASDLHDVIETLGRFLFGYFLLRIKLFESVESKAAVFRNVFFITLPVVVFYFVIRWQAAAGTMDTYSVFWKLFLKIGIFCTTCFYSSIVVLLFISFGQNRISMALQALGKMTLTNYLLVSAANITILYGVGFGQLGELPMHIIWLYAFGWLIAEIVFSIWWLSNYRYGPAEWIWRQLTYRKKLPLRK